MSFLAEVNQEGVTVLFIDQNVRRALGRAHRGYVPQSGRVSLAGPGDAILRHPELERIHFTRRR